MTKLLLAAITMTLALTACSTGSRRGPVSMVEQEVWLVNSTTLDVGVPSCNGDPALDRLEETSDEVRIQVVTTTHENGNDCLDAIRVELEQPLGDRELVDIPSGDVIEPKTSTS